MSHSVSHHAFADDTQMQKSCPPEPIGVRTGEYTASVRQPRFLHKMTFVEMLMNEHSLKYLVFEH